MSSYIYSLHRQEWVQIISAKVKHQYSLRTAFNFTAPTDSSLRGENAPYPVGHSTKGIYGCGHLKDQLKGKS